MSDFNNDPNANQSNGNYNNSPDQTSGSYNGGGNMNQPPSYGETMNQGTNNYEQQNTNNDYQSQGSNQNQYDTMNQYGGGGYGQGLPPEERDIEKKGMATASMVLGIVGLFTCCCGFFGVIISGLAIVFAIIAMNANKDNPAQKGRGAAKAGLIMGIIGVVFAIGMGVFGVIIQLQSPDFMQEILNEWEIQY